MFYLLHIVPCIFSRIQSSWELLIRKILFNCHHYFLDLIHCWLTDADFVGDLDLSLSTKDTLFC